MVKSSDYEILEFPFYIDTIYKKTHRHTNLWVSYMLKLYSDVVF